MHTDTSDISLLQAWQRHRDAEAFHAIVSRHARLVYNTCRHILRNDADAADVSQECFLCLATSPPKIQYSLSGWLHRLATHRSLDHLKAANRRRDREIRYVREAVVAGKDEQADFMAMVDEAIDALPDDLRLPLIDHFLRQKSHQEVADGLGIPRRTVTYRINGGVEQLRETLRKKGVVISAVALLDFLKVQASDATPIPETLQAALGKQAMAGAVKAGSGIAPPAAWAALKLGWIPVTVATIVIGGWWLVSNPIRQTETLSPDAAANRSPASLAENPGSIIANAAPPATVQNITPDASAAVLAGRVYDSATDAGVSGVEVNISIGGNTWTSISNDRGEYRADNLSPGTATVTVGEHEGYFAVENPVQQAVLDPASIAFADFALKPGQFTGVSGIVVDETGSPVSGAAVTAWSISYAGGKGQERETISGIDGHFEIEGLEVDGALFLKGLTDERACAPVGPLRLGNEGLADQHLSLQPVASASGIVLDKENQSVGTEYYVRAVLINPARPTAIAEVTDRSTFSIAALAPGTYNLFVESQHHSFSGIAVPQATVELAPGENKVEIALVTGIPQQLASIERSGGFQEEEEPRDLGTIEGVVRDASTREPIPAYSLAMDEHQLGISHHRKEFNSEDGIYSMPAREVESVVMTISAAGYGPETVTLSPANFTPPVTTINFSLQPGAVVEGTVVDGSGGPIAGAEILVNIKPEDVQFSLNRDDKRITTDTEGRFVLDSLRQEPARIYVVHPTYAYAWLDLTPSRAAPLAPVIKLSAGASVTGRVLLGEKPVPNQSIMAYNTEMRDLGYFRATTGSDGSFSMAYLPPGQYEVYTTIGLVGSRAPTAGQTERRGKQRITVSEGQTGNVELLFAQGSARVTGAIMINGANPEGHVRVTILPEGDSGADWQNDAEYSDGTYRAIDLPEGPTTIQIMALDTAGVRYIRNVKVLLLPFVELVQDIDIQGSPLVVEASGVGPGQTLELSLYDGVIEIDDAGHPDRDPRAEAMSAIFSIEEDGFKTISALPPGTYTAYGELFEYVEGKKSVLDTRVQNLEIRAEMENILPLAF